MISSFFKKTKPGNYFVIVILLLVTIVLHSYVLPLTAAKPIFLGTALLNFGLLLVSVFVLGAVVYQNKLTKNNTFAIFLFTLFLLLFPEVLTNTKLIVANLFVVLALRRIVGLSTGRNTKAKLLDSFLLVGIACIFNSWAVVYFVSCFMGILFFQYKDFRNWLIPFIAFGILWMSYVIYQFYVERACAIPEIPQDLYPVFNISRFTSPLFLTCFSFLFVVGIYAFVMFLATFQSKSIHLQKPFWLLFIGLLLATTIVAFSASGISAMLFTFFPLAIFIATLIERIKIKWLRESILAVFILLALANLML